jgi:hypothetical protein
LEIKGEGQFFVLRCSFFVTATARAEGNGKSNEEVPSSRFAVLGKGNGKGKDKGKARR